MAAATLPRIKKTPAKSITVGEYVLGTEGFTGTPVIGSVTEIEHIVNTVRVFYRFAENGIVQYRMQSFPADGLVTTVTI